MAPATLNETGLSGTPSTPGPFIAGLGALQPAAGSDHTRAITPADLQSAREARRWTRLDVARQTKFQVRQITALEEGRFDELPGVMERLAAGSLPALCHTIAYDRE